MVKVSEDKMERIVDLNENKAIPLSVLRNGTDVSVIKIIIIIIILYLFVLKYIAL
jgi:hypothetical protein